MVDSFPKIKRLKPEDGHYSPSSTEVKSVGNYTSTPAYSVASSLINNMYNFYFFSVICWYFINYRDNVSYSDITGCNRRNGPDFWRVFLRSNYTDITQNTYIQSWTFTEILAREKSGLLWCLRTVLVGIVIPPLLELNSYVIVRCSASDLDNGQASKSV